MALPINHLKRTLDRCCGQWEFVESPTTNMNFRVRFLNTNRRFLFTFLFGRWEAYELSGDEDKETLDARLTGILNGLTRDDAGDLPSDFACVPGVE